MADKNDPLTLTSLTELVTLNGKTSTAQFDKTAATWTYTSPLNRVRTVKIDSQNRPIADTVADLSPVQYGYDANGRLKSVRQDSGLNVRETRYDYYATTDPATGAYQGALAQVTDALNRTVTFRYDLAGRVTRQTLPDRVFGGLSLRSESALRHFIDFINTIFHDEIKIYSSSFFISMCHVFIILYNKLHII